MFVGLVFGSLVIEITRWAQKTRLVRKEEVV